MIISENAVVIVQRANKVVYHDGDRIIKVFNDVKPASDVFNESLNTARVAETGIRVSDPLEVSQVESGEYEGCWALANRYVPGKNLHQAFDEAEANGTFDEVFDRFVDLQLEVQGFRAPLLNRQKDKLNRMISDTKGIIDATTRYDLHIRVEGMMADERVCHGDFVPSNVILGDDGELYLCDWAHVTAGAPDVDAAMTYLLFSLRHPQSAERYLKRYCERADVARQQIMRWMPVIAAAELSRGRKRDEEFLKGWVNVYTGE